MQPSSPKPASAVKDPCSETFVPLASVCARDRRCPADEKTGPVRAGRGGDGLLPAPLICFGVVRFPVSLYEICGAAEIGALGRKRHIRQRLTENL